jgi:cytidine deaminase
MRVKLLTAVKRALEVLQIQPDLVRTDTGERGDGELNELCEMLSDAGPQEIKFAELEQCDQVLLHVAAQCANTAYNPYSNFLVGAAFADSKGKTYAASNMENAAYGSTICAERFALGKANSAGARDLKVMALIGRGRTFDAPDITSPCGSCRQMIFEAAQVSGHDICCIMSNSGMTKIVVATASELLPLGFGPNQVGTDISKFKPGPYHDIGSKV